jgi:hypothetical protein
MIDLACLLDSHQRINVVFHFAKKGIFSAFEGTDKEGEVSSHYIRGGF